MHCCSSTIVVKPAPHPSRPSPVSCWVTSSTVTTTPLGAEAGLNQLAGNATAFSPSLVVKTVCVAPGGGVLETTCEPQLLLFLQFHPCSTRSLIGNVRPSSNGMYWLVTTFLS